MKEIITVTKKYKPKDGVESHIKPIAQNVDSDGIVIPPKPTLEDLFNKRKLNEAKISKMGAFQFFCWLLESPKPKDKPELRRTMDKYKKEVNVWVWPFAVQFIHNCFKFLGLNRGDQSYIVAAREDNVYWRGDEPDFFRTVYENTMDWRALPDDEKHKRKEDLNEKLPKTEESPTEAF